MRSGLRSGAAEASGSSYHTNAYVIEFENVIPVLTPTSVPTLSWGGQIALITLLASIGVGFLLRRIAG